MQWLIILFLFFPELVLSKSLVTSPYTDMSKSVTKTINQKDYEIHVFNYEAVMASVKELKTRFSKKLSAGFLGVASGYKFPFLVTKHQTKPKYKVLVVAGQHGYESLSSLAVMRWMEKNLNANFFKNQEIQVVLVPMANPWGADNVSRHDHNGEDPNRGFYKNSPMLLKGWIDNLVEEHGPFDLAMDIHGSLYKEGLFVVQNEGTDSSFAIGALRGIAQDLLSKSDNGEYPGFRGTNTNPEKYTMIAPGLSTSATHGTLKAYLQDSGAAKRSYTLEYSDKMDAQKKLSVFENLIQRMVLSLGDTE